MTKPEKEMQGKPSAEASLFSDYDVHLFKEGKHFHLHKKLGSHPMEHQGKKGTYFALWAPNAQQVTLIGAFNHWNRNSHYMNSRPDGSGIWEIFVPDVHQGTIYKYFIR